MTAVPDGLPMVSVLTTSYNREAYIAETIESVLAQTFTDFEYIIVDDCSADRTFEIARQYAARDSRIRVFRNETNLGDYPNRNKAASYAAGRYLKFIDSDDILYPHALDMCVYYMEQFPEAGLSLSKIHDQDQPLPQCLSPRSAYQLHFLARELFTNAPGSVVIRRTAFEAAGCFSGRRMIGDLEMWFRLAAMSPTLLFPGFINWDRRHPGQESNFDPLEYFELQLNVAKAALGSANCPLHEAERELAERRLRLRAAMTGVRHLTLGPALKKSLRFLRVSGCSPVDILCGAVTCMPGIRQLFPFRI